MENGKPRPWTTLATEVLGTYPIFELSRSRQQSPMSGREHHFLRLDCPDWVNVIAVTEAGLMVLVEQYRHGTDEMTMEIPGGAVDPGEAPAVAAARELEEETGYRARSSSKSAGSIPTRPFSPIDAGPISPWGAARTAKSTSTHRRRSRFRLPRSGTSLA